MSTRHAYTRALMACAFVALATSASAQSRQLMRYDVGLRADLDEWYQSESDRLVKQCSQEAECWRREMKPREWIQGPVFGKPDAASAPLGHIVALARVMKDAAALEVPLVFRATDGTVVDWITDHDWGYTTAVYVRDVRPGDWVRLPQPGAPNAWVKIGDGPSQLPGYLQDDLGGELVRIRGGLAAVDRKTGRPIRLPEAPPDSWKPEQGAYYLIERIRPDGWIEFRPEVGADMACGNEEDEKQVVTPVTSRYRIRLDSLFDKIGRPMLTLSHPKGC
jgi:hypothetical protein